MKTSQEDVLERPAAQEPDLLIGKSFESHSTVVAPEVRTRREARTRLAPKGAGEGARHLRLWASQQLAETQTAEGLVFQLLLASGVVLIVISFWL